MPRGIYKRTAWHHQVCSLTKRRFWREHPEARARQARRISKFNGTLRMRRLQSERVCKLNRSPEMRKFQSLRMQERMRDPKYAKKVAKSWSNVTSKPQVSLFRRLCRAGIRGLKLEHPIGGFVADIAHLPTKIVIESDGSHFHRHRVKHDQRRDRLLRKLGWIVIRVRLESRKQARNFDISKLVSILKQGE